MPLRTFTYKESVVQPAEPVQNKAIDTSIYITRDELEHRLERLEKALKKENKDE